MQASRLCYARTGLKAGPLEEQRVAAQVDCPEGLGEDSARLLAAVMRLPWQQRQVVMLRYFGGWKVREIAEIASCPVGTISVRLSRAHKRLRKILGGTG